MSYLYKNKFVWNLLYLFSYHGQVLKVKNERNPPVLNGFCDYLNRGSAPCFPFVGSRGSLALFFYSNFLILGAASQIAMRRIKRKPELIITACLSPITEAIWPTQSEPKGINPKKDRE